MPLLPQVQGAGLPPEIMAALQQRMGGGAPPEAPPEGGGGGGGNPLEALQRVIQDTHELLTLLDDPADVQTVTQCLGALARVQTKLMGNAQGGGGR